MRFYLSLILFTILLFVQETTVARSKSEIEPPPIKFELCKIEVAYCNEIVIQKEEAKHEDIPNQEMIWGGVRQNYQGIYFIGRQKNKDYLVVCLLNFKNFDFYSMPSHYQVPYRC